MSITVSCGQAASQRESQHAAGVMFVASPSSTSQHWRRDCVLGHRCRGVLPHLLVRTAILAASNYDPNNLGAGYGWVTRYYRGVSGKSSIMCVDLGEVQTHSDPLLRASRFDSITSTVDDLSISVSDSLCSDEADIPCHLSSPDTLSESEPTNERGTFKLSSVTGTSPAWIALTSRSPSLSKESSQPFSLETTNDDSPRESRLRSNTSASPSCRVVIVVCWGLLALWFAAWRRRRKRDMRIAVILHRGIVREIGNRGARQRWGKHVRF